MTDFDYREDTEGTVDTWELLDQQRADAPGNFQVPPGVRTITKLTFSAAPDFGGAVILRLATAFRLTGNALRSELKPYLFPGPAGGVSVTTDGTVFAFAPKISYSPTPPIPLAEPGTEFSIAGKFIGEDSGDVQFAAEVEYDGPGGGLPFRAADVREDDLADATEALVTIDTEITEDTAAANATSNFLPPPGVSRLAYAVYGVGLDVAVATRFMHQFELDGDGLKAERKPKRWSGWSGFQALTTVGGNGALAAPEVKTLDQAIVPNFRIIARAGMVEDDYGAGTVVMGLLYL